jgi:Fe-S cluster biosynthesis and repair protein YggX
VSPSPEAAGVPRVVFCSFLGREAEGLDRIPYPGPLGQRIFDSISREAWQQWVRHQTMLMNEYRLTPIDPKARQFLVEEMEKFLFGTGSQKPEGFVSPDS